MRGAPAARDSVAHHLDAAARSHGFFYAVNHGVDAALIDRLVSHARAFFAQSEAAKMQIPMSAGGRAWRGYFPLGGELTSNRPDWKEGLYLGSELGPEHPRVRAGTILHGANLWPRVTHRRLSRHRARVHRCAHAPGPRADGRLRARRSGLPERWFAESGGTADPLILLRLFNYPSRPVPAGTPALWGVGEHTDYGLLTMLWQDDVGGLQVRTDEGWIDAPPLPGSFVCNVGDMLDRMTGGRYRSLPHRVAINASGRDRLSIPLFFDPDFAWRVCAGAGRERGLRRQRPPLGRRQPAGLRGHVWRLRDREGGQGVSGVEAAGGGRRLTPTSAHRRRDKSPRCAS